MAWTGRCLLAVVMYITQSMSNTAMADSPRTRAHLCGFQRTEAFGVSQPRGPQKCPYLSCIGQYIMSWL